MTSKSSLYTPSFIIGFTYNFFVSINFINHALYPLYVTDSGGNASTIGLFMSVYALTAVLFRPLIGLMIDREGPVKVMMLGSALLALPNLVFIAGIGEGLPWYVWAARAIQGFGFGAHFSATFTFAGDAAPEGRRNEAMAMFGVSGLTGAIVGPPVGEYILNNVGMQALFLFILVSALLGTAIAMTLHAKVERHKTDYSLRMLVELMKSRRLHLALFLALMISVCFATPISFLAKLAQEKQVAGFGLYFTGVGIGGIFIRFLAGSWGDTYGLRRVLLPSFLLYGVGLSVVWFSESVELFFAAGILNGVAHGVAFPAVATLGYTFAPRQLSGSIMAIVTGMMDLGNAATAVLFGMLAESQGYASVFPAAAACGIAGGLVVLVSIIRRPGKIRPSESA